MKRNANEQPAALTPAARLKNGLPLMARQAPSLAGIRADGHPFDAFPVLGTSGFSVEQ
ncbi:hypothetical protein ABIC83_004382 [Roseateles asaccharophilus]|uniref:Uncharacterized protein n=1 Tax=Roseateles asaccharophilus TaxID=582607 RepID=A0ABU2A921_9BURK|nr:hypothetical protein [Roseateles asaccharophilus]